MRLTYDLIANYTYNLEVLIRHPLVDQQEFYTEFPVWLNDKLVVENQLLSDYSCC